MQDRILFVDDDQNILDAYQRSLRRQFEIDVAPGGLPGLERIASGGPYSVVVSDMRMPGMDGVQFLGRVKELAPDSVRIMLTGNADLQTAINAVNEGCVFRFVTKPCPPDDLAKTLAEGLAQHRLIAAERELLENTVQGSVQVLTDILALVNPTAFGRSARVRRIVGRIATELGIPDRWQAEVAAMLSHVGCVTIPEETLARAMRGGQLSREELQMLQTHPQVGRDLIRRIPRMEPVAEIIAYQDKRYNGAGLPSDDLRWESIPVGARILKLALDFDKLRASGANHAEALAEVQSRGDWYDPKAVAALVSAIAADTTYEEATVPISGLAPGMILCEDVNTRKGVLIVTGGLEANRTLIMRLKNFADAGSIEPAIRVMVPVRAD